MSGMTRKWLIAILIILAVVLAIAFLYTGYASEEVEPEVAEDPVSVVVPASSAQVPLPG